jgi:hypothetical protein
MAASRSVRLIISSVFFVACGGGLCIIDPPATPDPSKEILEDLSLNLDQIPLDAFATLLSAGLQLGTNVGGAVPASELNGDWTGTFRSNEFGDEINVDITFDSSGSLGAIFQRGGTLDFVVQNFATQEIFEIGFADGGTGGIRPVASSVTVNNTGGLTIEAINVQDIDREAGRSRFRETITFELTLNSADGVLTGSSLTEDEVINSAVAGTEIGIVFRGSAQGTLNKTDLSPGRAIEQLLHGDRSLEDYDEAVIAAALQTDEEFGATVSGNVGKELLPGLWAARLTGPDGGFNGDVWNMEFDATGRLIHTMIGASDGLPALPLDFANRTFFQPDEGNATLPLSSQVSDSERGNAVVKALWLRETTSEGGQRARFSSSLLMVIGPTLGPEDWLIATGTIDRDVLANDDLSQSVGDDVDGEPDGLLVPVRPMYADADATRTFTDSSISIVDMSDDTLQGLLPPDVPVGMAVTGPGDAAALSGQWDMSDQSLAGPGEDSVVLEFDSSGRMIKWGDWNFETREPFVIESSNDVRTFVPLASRVEATGERFDATGFVIDEVAFDSGEKFRGIAIVEYMLTLRDETTVTGVRTFTFAFPPDRFPNIASPFYVPNLSASNGARQ